MAFQLRILSGKHKGAELRLETRRYALGSSEENALILSDSNIAKKHISFFFAEGEISVLSANGGLLVDGVKIDKFPIDVAPLQVMTLAGDTMANNVSLAFRETRASGNESGNASHGASGNQSGNQSGDDASNNWPDDKKLEELLAKNNLANASAADAQKTRQAKKKLGAFARIGSSMGASMGAERNLVPSTIAIIATIATIALLGIVALLWFDPARWQAERMQKVEEKLEKELAEKPKSQRTVRIEQEDDGGFVLLGYVETEKELVRLRGLAFESGLQIRVVSKEQLLAAIEVIAKQYKLYANFKLMPAYKPSATLASSNAKTKVAMPQIAAQKKKGKNLYSFEDLSSEDLQGDADKLITAQEFYQRRKRETQHFKLRAEGFVEHERKLDTFRNAILQSLPYIVEVEMDVTTNELMLEVMRNALSKNIAFSGVQLNLDLGQLIISGAIFANFHDEMQEILQKQYQKLPRAPIHKERITLAPPFYAKITALLLGRQRAVDLRMRNDSSPKRYLVGQLIDNDKTVIAIADNGIILNYRNESIGFPISNTAVALPTLKQENKQENKQESQQESQQEKSQENSEGNSEESSAKSEVTP